MLSLRITEIRNARKLTQADLAQYLRITQQTYSAYETNRRQMSYETLCMLADFYEVSTDYLLGRQEAMPSFLSEEERGIIEQYRALDERTKDGIKNTIAFEYSRAPKSEASGKSAI